jgi:hypothetical protein
MFGKKRNVTNNLIEVTVTGIFLTYDKKKINYCVRIKTPDCDDLFLGSIIKARYLKAAILQGKEYTANGETPNDKYAYLSRIITMYVDMESIKVLDEQPSFYGKSLFDFDYTEIQDFAVAFGLSRIPTDGQLKTLRDFAFKEYVTNVLGRKKEDFTFYKYDSARRYYYFDLDDETKKKFTIGKRYNREEDKLNPDEIVNKDVVDTETLIDEFNTANGNLNYNNKKNIKKTQRDLLAEEAEKLGLTFNQNISSKKLKELIDESKKSNVWGAETTETTEDDALIGGNDGIVDIIDADGKQTSLDVSVII